MFSYTSIKDYHQYLQSKQNGCYEAVSFYLNEIKSQQQLNAFLEVFEEDALQRAKALDEQRSNNLPIGKLHGVVIALKDVICYKNHKLSAASKILENFTSLYSATAVERLLNEGAIIIGRNNCDEFAMGSSSENSAYGNVKNALDETRVPGGSSGGSAVAVQANLCMLSLGTDTGGSVRQPADFCGIIGFKPSYGRVSRHGLLAYASSFDQIGIFGKNIDDVSLVLQVISGGDEYDQTISKQPVFAANISSSKALKEYKIAYFNETIDNSFIDEEIKQKITNQLRILKDKGCVVEAVPFPYLDYIVPTYYVLTTAEASSNLSRYDGLRFGKAEPITNQTLSEFYKQNRTNGFGKEVKKRIMLGNFVLSSGYYDAYFTKAQQVSQLLQQTAQQIFEQYDFIISPTVTATAFKIGEKSDNPVAMYLADIYTVFANLVGIPAISVPLFKHSKTNMPFGLQAMANSFEEKDLLAFSKQLLNQ